MDPILLLLFLIILGGISLGLVTLHTGLVRRLSKRCARKIEYWGYVFLFILIFIQLVVGEFMLSEFSQPDLYIIDRKLDAIYSTIKTENTFVQNGYYYNIQDELETSKSQVNFSNIASLILGAVSSIFIAIGRLHEISEEE